jgi:hypothetical protein
MQTVRAVRLERRSHFTMNNETQDKVYSKYGMAGTCTEALPEPA